MIWHRTRLLLVFTTLVACAAGQQGEFLDAGTVHDAVLSLQPDQWRVLEPKEHDPVANPAGPGAGGIRDAEFGYAHADLVMDGVSVADVAVRYKGHGTYRQSRATLKRPFKVDLNEFVKGRKLSGAGKINFNNNVADPSFMNEAIAYSLYREAGVPAPRTAHARLSVTVPGHFDRRYLGLYTLVENPDQNWAEGQFGSRRGMILKPTTQALFAYHGEEWSRYREGYDPRTTVRESQARRVIEFARLVSLADDATFAARLPEFLDLEAFALFMAVTVNLSSLDSILGMGGNFIVYLDPETRRFSFAPWDLDQAFGGTGGVGTQEQRERLSLERPWIGTNRFLERVFAVEAFRGLYRADLGTLSSGLFLPERLAERVDVLRKRIRPAVSDEGPVIEARFDRSVAGLPVAPVGPDGGIPAEGAVDINGLPKPVRSFSVVRHASVVAQLGGLDAGLTIGTVPVASPAGGPARGLADAVVARMDANRDGMVARKEMADTVERWLVEWTGSSSGILRLDSLVAGLRLLGNRTEARPGDPIEFLARRVMAEFDLDQSGALSRTELTGGFLGWFGRWDPTNSGRIPAAVFAGNLAAQAFPGR